MRKYRGQFTIELEDQNTGAVEIVSETNMITNAVNDLLGSNPMGLFYHTAGRYDTEMNWNDEMLPICPNMIGGLLLFSSAITEQVANIYPSSSNLPVAYASNDVNATANVKRGSMNLTESMALSDGYKFVWEFTPSQGNGTIAAIGLTSKQGGANAYGSDVAVDTALLLLRQNSLDLTVEWLNTLFRTVEVDFENGLLYAYGATGLMGNLYAESGLRANNLQNSYEKKLNITDEEYTRLVDDNAYPDFVKDKAGYGLAQWTFWSRKKALLEYAKAKGKSIGDLDMQLDFLWKELNTGYQAVLIVLQNAENVREASDAVLLWYERSADQSDAVQKKRAGYGQGYYEKYAGGNVPSSAGMSNADCPFLVRVTTKDLRIRKGNGTDTAWTGKYVPPGVYTIVEVKEGKGSDAGWGRLKSGAGWIALSYAKRV